MYSSWQPVRCDEAPLSLGWGVPRPGVQGEIFAKKRDREQLFRIVKTTIFKISSNFYIDFWTSYSFHPHLWQNILAAALAPVTGSQPLTPPQSASDTQECGIADSYFEIKTWDETSGLSYFQPWCFNDEAWRGHWRMTPLLPTLGRDFKEVGNHNRLNNL